MRRPSEVLPRSAILLCLLLVVPVDAKPQPGPEYVEKQVIVKRSRGLREADVEAVREDLKSSVIRRFTLVGAELWTLSDVTVEEAIQRYKDDPRIEYIEPNFIVRLCDIHPDDPEFDQLWGLHNTGQTGGTPDADIDAPEAWEIGTGGSVIVGVIDTGVDWLHEDLSANIWTNPGEIPNNGIDDDGNGYVDDVRGWDFVNDDNDPMDDNGHGTHVAGTIAAAGDNGAGVAGVCWSAMIMPLKTLSSGGGGNIADMVAAIEYATMMGAKLTSNSWGGGGYSVTFHNAIEASEAAGLLLIAAAGNDGLDTDSTPHYPSAYDFDSIISVAATDHNDELASFSNYGAISVDLGAPGVDVLSCLPEDGYGYKSGTSMATPHVSGVAALVWSQYPGASSSEVKSRILAAADTLPSLAGITVTGGRLNAFRALAEADSIAPSAIADLAATNYTSNAIDLIWTATGDDSASGRAVSYDLRYSLSPIDSSNFDSAFQVSDVPHPHMSGTPESLTVSGLDFNTTYYFAIKAKDEWGNTSAVSNCPSGTTLGIPTAGLIPSSLNDSLVTGETSDHLVRMLNLGEGSLVFYISFGGESAPQGEGMSALYTLTTPEAAGAPEGEGDGPPPIARRTEALTARLADLTGTQVMYDRSHGQVTSAYWSTLIADLTLRGAVVAVNYDEITPALLADYDVYWATDVGEPWSGEELTALSDWVSMGGGLLLEGDDSSAEFNSFLAAVSAGIELSAGGGTSGTTTNINDHETTEDVESIYIEDNHAHISSVVGEAVTLIEDSKGLPNTAAGVSGIGKIIVMAEELSLDTLITAEDNQLFVNQAFDWLAVGAGWLNADPSSGTVYAGDSLEVVVTLDASRLQGGDYEATLYVESNDPIDPEISAPVQLHVTGGSDIAVADSVLDYGAVFVQSSARDTLVVWNEGPESLTVGGVSVDNPAFSTDTSSFILRPGESRDLTVTFAPTELGIAEGLLTIQSNDPDEPTVSVTLSGEGLEAPEATVSPDSLSYDLETGGVSSHALTIGNESGSDLEWRVRAVKTTSGPAMQSYTLAPLEAEPFGPEGGEPAPPAKTAPRETILAVLNDLAGISIMYDQSHGQPPPDTWTTIVADLTARGGTVAVNSDTITSGLLSGYDVVWVVDGGGYWTEDERYALADWVTAGGGLLLEGDDNSAKYNAILDALGVGIEYSATHGMSGPTTNVHPHETTRNLESIYIGDNHCYLSSVAQPAQILIEDAAGLINTAAATVGHGRVLATAEELFNNGQIGLNDNRVFGNQVFDWLALGINWLTAVPASGAISGGDSVVVSITCDATGFYGGDYGASLLLESNDPIAPEVPIPVHLHVTSAPDVAVSDTVLTYEPLFIGNTTRDTLVISNVGAASLVVSEITINHAAFSADSSGFVLAVDERKELPVEFKPEEAGIIEGTLAVVCDDPDEATVLVSLQGEGLQPPVIAVSPDSLADSLSTGETSQQILSIENTGNSGLVFNIVEGSSGFLMDALSIRGTKVLSRARSSRERTPPAAELRPGYKGVPYDDGLSPLRPLIVADESGTGSAAESGKRILIVEHSGDVSEIRDLLLAYSDISAVDVLDEQSEVPSLETFMEYHCVIVANNHRFDDPAALGNVLADYVDSGGAVVLTVPSFIDWFGVEGRFRDEGYTPFTGTEAGGFAALGSFDVNHPIMAGVSDAEGDALADASLTEGATWVADWDNGMPFVATKGSNVVGVNVFVGGPASWIGDVPLILHNAVFWAIGERLCWVSSLPMFGIVPSHTIAEVTVSFSAGEGCVVDGSYLDTLFVESNDPAAPRLSVPLYLHVTGEPDIAVSETALSYGEVTIGDTASDTLVIANIGTDSLVVSDVAIDTAAFSADISAFALAVGDSIGLAVEFSPTEVGAVTGTLTLTSNDPDEPALDVLLSGTGSEGAEIAVYPDSLSVSLAAEGTTTRVLTIKKEGTGDLQWSLHFSESSGGGMGPLSLIRSEADSIGPEGDATHSDREGAGAVRDAPQAGAIGAEVADLSGISIMYDKRHYQSSSSYWSTIIADLTARGATVTENRSMFTPELLANYDVVWTTATQFWSWNIPERGTFSDWVTSGGAVLFEGDSREDDFNDLLTILGADLRYSTTFGTSGTTSNIFPHGATRNVEAIWLLDNRARLSVTGSALRLVDDANNVPNAAYEIVGEGRIVCMADENFKNDAIGSADNQLFARQVFEWLARGVSWLSADLYSGTLSSGDSVNVQVDFDAANLVTGGYYADAVVESDDPVAPEVIVPVHLQVIGVPDIAVSDYTLDFGEVPVGGDEWRELDVSNVGTDSLTVSGVSVDNAVFSAETSGFVLQINEMREILVQFTPDATGTVQGTLTIESDDPDEPSVNVTLQGVGVAPPQIALHPDSFSDSLFTGGTSQHALTITNEGVSDLEWRIVFHSSDPPAQALASRPSEVAALYADGLGRPVYPAAAQDQSPSGPADLAGVNIMFEREHCSYSIDFWAIIVGDLTARGATVTESSGPITPELLAGYDLVWTSSPNSDWTNEERYALRDWIELGGGLLLEGETSVTVFNDILSTLGAGIEYSAANGDPGWSTNVYPHETTEGVNSIYLGSPSAHLSTVTDPAVLLVEDPEHVPNTACSEVGLGRIVATADQLFRDTSMDEVDNRLFGNQVFDWIAGRMSWITASPASGTVGIGDSVVVGLNLNAAGLYGGDYGAALVVGSNDPLASESALPVELHVTGVPDITAADSLLDFGTVFIGYDSSDTLVISNVGVDSLLVSEVSIDNPAFHVDSSGFVLDVGESMELVVTFAPGGPGPSQGTLTVSSDDPDEPQVDVLLQGTGLEPPQVAFYPASFADTLIAGASDEHTLIIRNDGQSDLPWRLSARRNVAAPLFMATSSRFGPADGEDGLSGMIVGTAALGDTLADLTGVRIMYDRTHGQRYLYGTILELLTARGATVTENFDTITLELLADYDVLWSRWGDYSWNASVRSAIVQWVMVGGGLLMEGEHSVTVQSFNAILAELGAGIEFSTDGGAGGTTTNIYPHVTTAGVGSIFMLNYYAQLSSVTAPAVLVIEDELNIPNTACSAVGAGRIVAMADDSKFDSNRIILEDNMLFANQVFDWLALGVNWLSTAPESGTVAAGDSVTVAVTLDSEDLELGHYDASFLLESNDPASPESLLPVYLYVKDDPDIDVSATGIQFGPVHLGSTASDTLLISNVGSIPLAVNEIRIDNPAFSADASEFFLDPGELKKVGVEFTPDTLGMMAGTLTVMSNDPDEPSVSVSLLGRGKYPIDLISPNGGEEWALGEHRTISWTTQSAPPPDSLGLFLSLDGGLTFGDTLATGLAATSSYNWIILSDASTTARVMVVAYMYGDSAAADISDAYFTIMDNNLLYVSPSGGNIYPYRTPQFAAHIIQDAVDAGVAGDTVLVAASTYDSAVTVSAPIYLKGGWDSTFADWDPEAHVTTIQSAGSPVSFLDAGGDSCGIEGFTITGGTGTYASLPSNGFYGGGVYSYLSSPTIRGNKFTGCGYVSPTDFSGGGAIFCYGGSVAIENNEITGCLAQNGGGIYLFQSNALVLGNLVSGSAPDESYPGVKAGGGVYISHSTVTVGENVITDNDGYVNGGGVYMEASTVTMEADTVSWNDCSGTGGGIYSERSSLSADDAAIMGNSAESAGGGVYHRAESLDITNSLVISNEAGTTGGGVYADSTWGRLTNNTLDGNVSGTGGGNLYVTGSVSLEIKNNVITYGWANGFEADNLDNLDFEFNNCFGNLPEDVAGVTPDPTNISGNPHYADTTAADYHLLVHSASIDAGDPAGSPDPDGSRADQGVFGGPGAAMAAPEYVKNLTAIAVSDTTVKLAWDALPPADLENYAVYGDTTDGFVPGEEFFIASVTAPEDTFLHEPVVGCWYYRVSGVNASGYGGGYSDQGDACAAGPDLVPPEVTVMQPNGGEILVVGNSVDIEWVATDNRGVDSVSIYFSIDGGGDFTVIATGEANDSLYAWIAPPVESESCLVKIVAFDSALLVGEDVSDNMFTITGQTVAVPDTTHFTNSLGRNYPNPFKDCTQIPYSLKKSGLVSLKVYDASGRLVKVLYKGWSKAGRNQAVWHGTDSHGRAVASGIYFCRIVTESFTKTNKIVLLR